MLISGILFIIIGLLTLSLIIIKTVKMMKADSNTKIKKYNNTYDKFTEVNTSEYNDINREAKNRYFKGTTQGVRMESENPVIIKTWLFGFGAFWFLFGMGVHLVIANFTCINIELGMTFCIFVFLPFLFVIMKGFLYKNKE
jgi:hypothetical protein